MAKLSDLQKYLDYEFSTGFYTGNDYKTFQTKYINYLHTLVKEHHWELVNIIRSHYQFSLFITNRCKYVYISISDVRFFRNAWYNHILIRTAASEHDYHGGMNHYCSLTELTHVVTLLLNQ